MKSDKFLENQRHSPHPTKEPLVDCALWTGVKSDKDASRFTAIKMGQNYAVCTDKALTASSFPWSACSHFSKRSKGVLGLSYTRFLLEPIRIVLIAHDADINAENKYGGTALRVALKHRRTRIVDLLKKAGAKMLV